MLYIDEYTKSTMYDISNTKYMLRRVRLWNAAMNGDVNEFLYQINRFQRESNVSTSLKEYINSRNEANGHNALTSACIGGHLSIIKYLRKVFSVALKTLLLFSKKIPLLFHRLFYGRKKAPDT